MPNHPNRGPKGPAANPTPEEVRAAREAAGLSQTAAAALIHCTMRGWQEWEAGNRRMHPAFWELFQIKRIDLAHALVFELLLSQLPAQKVMIADALSQILSTPDVTATIPNEFCVSLLRSYEKIARNPPRTTPEGRRGWIHVVNPEESSPPEP